MSHAYTDSMGYPVSAIEAARRATAPKRRGYYNAAGQWVRLSGTAKRKPAEKPQPTRTPSSAG